MIYHCINAFYFKNINRIGGTQSFFYYISRKYSADYDITVFYSICDPEQLVKLKKYARCIQLRKNDKVVCKNMFCCYHRDILAQCKADKVYFVLHGDYKSIIEKGQISRSNLPIDSRVDEYVGVSQLVCDSWYEMSGIRATNLYEPVVLDEVERPLMFVSATRLTMEKGWDRMIKLAKELDSNKVNYLWFIYTDAKKTPIGNMVFVEPRLDICDKIGGFDAFIQLSDNEGFCLSVVEALKRGVPVIVTELPVLKEIGVDSSNSVMLPFDMSDIPIDEIRNIRKKKFVYESPEDKWGDVLDNTRKTDKIIKVRATDNYKKYGIYDIEQKKVPANGEEWTIDWYRYEELMAFEEQKRIKLIEVIDEIH